MVQGNLVLLFQSQHWLPLLAAWVEGRRLVKRERLRRSDKSRGKLVWLGEEPFGTKPHESEDNSFWKVVWHCQTGATLPQEIHLDWEAWAGVHANQFLLKVLSHREQGHSYTRNWLVAAHRRRWVSGSEGMDLRGQRNRKNRLFEIFMLGTLQFTKLLGVSHDAWPSQEGLPRSYSQGLPDQHSKIRSGPLFRSWKPSSQDSQFILPGCRALSSCEPLKGDPGVCCIYVRSPVSPEGLSDFASAPVTSLNRELWFPWGGAHPEDMKLNGSRAVGLLNYKGSYRVHLMKGAISMSYLVSRPCH